ncbi:MAG: hypothetical protein LBQ52_08570 [Helicobacteraceae bacterium]|jgi:hypothetical protein|nr:hypothetical protein [Helicobacteraceae bacterium]
MIKATLYFDKPFDVVNVVNDLTCLPEAIKPFYFTANEGRIPKANVLSDKTKFLDFYKNNSIGFLLYSENKKSSFDISIHNYGRADVTLWIPKYLSGELIVPLFKNLVKYNPVFGLACNIDEYKHRNRHCFDIGINHMDYGMGEDLNKYIPGMYWYTLISDRLLMRHSVKLNDLLSETLVAEKLGDKSIHLLKFFEKPEDWQENSKRLDELCYSVDGVFSRRIVDVAISEISDINWKKYSEIMHNWQ